jgi:hypothetical protein
MAAAAYVQPTAAREDTAQPQAATADLTIWVSPDCPPLDAFDAVDFNGAR